MYYIVGGGYLNESSNFSKVVHFGALVSQYVVCGVTRLRSLR